MKKITLLLLLAVVMTSNVTWAKESKFAKKLAALPGVTSVKPFKSSRFKEAYIITFTQYTDYADTKAGTFTQRALVCHVHEDSATVLVTEGYGLDYYLTKPDYREELSDIFNTNCVIVEHRYFGESKPAVEKKELYWRYLTTFNAATDHHRFSEVFHKLYHGKFIATGVSKGGICANMFRAYYPQDVDITVPYVAPLCDGPEDPRLAKAIMEYGTPDEQLFIRKFIEYMFKNRDTYIPMLEKHCIEHDMQPRIPYDELYDYAVMDMHVAILARGEIKKIPEYTKCPADTTFAFLVKYGAPEGFTPQYDNMPYYVQAIRELGHYALMPGCYAGPKAVEDTHDYLIRTALPEESHFRYDHRMRDKVIKYLNTEAERMIFIYGEYDPWTAVGIKDLVKNDKVYVFINPGNCHRSKIRNFPKEEQGKIMYLLSEWLYKK